MNTIIQHDHTSCGPISVSNVLRLLNKKPPSVKKLRKLCKTDYKGLGTATKDLINCFNKLGVSLKKKTRRRNKGLFVALIETPAGWGHFIVIKNNYAYNLYKGVYKCKIKERLSYRSIFQIKKET